MAPKRRGPDKPPCGWLSPTVTFRRNLEISKNIELRGGIRSREIFFRISTFGRGVEAGENGAQGVFPPALFRRRRQDSRHYSLPERYSVLQ